MTTEMRKKEIIILDYLNERLTDDDRVSLGEWVASTDENQRFFDEIKKIHDLSELDADKFSPNVDSAWDKVRMAISKEKRGNTQLYLRLAAMITLVIGVVFAVQQFSGNDDFLIATTGDDEIRQIDLADGSHVWLSENTKFMYPKSMNAEQRIVELNGEAFFDIAKDANRPFRILGSTTTVEVLGTSFNLISTSKYSNVNVQSGKVAFSLANEEEKRLVLEKGNQATYKNKTLKMDESFNENAASWMTSDFIFKSSPLLEVAKILSDHFKVEIKVDSSIEKCLITSSFQDKDLNQILEVLDAIGNIKNKQEGKVITLTGPGC